MIPLAYFSIAYGMSEILLLIIKRSKVHSVKVRSDRGSMILLWLAITFGFTGGFVFSSPDNVILLGFGYGTIVCGIIIRFISIIQLGKRFTVDVAITDSATLKTDGIYKRLRHPSYSGLIAIIAGFGLAMNSILSFMILVVPVLVAVVYRIHIEEMLLTKEFGDIYTKYIFETKRIIPGVY